MSTRRFLTRRRVFSVLAILLALFGLAMLHPYPRQSLFGPKIRGEPWCVWEDTLRRRVHEIEHGRSMWTKLMRWMGAAAKDELDFNDPELLPLMIELAEDRDPKIRSAVLMTFAYSETFLDRAALPMLHRRLKGEGTEHLCYAAIAIWRIDKDRAMIPALIRELDDPRVDRANAFAGLEFMCSEAPDVLPMIVPLASHPQKEVRLETISLMKQFGQECVPVLIQALDDPAKEVRILAISRLSVRDDVKKAEPALLRLARSDEPEVRVFATDLLCQIDRERFGYLKTGKD